MELVTPQQAWQILQTADCLYTEAQVETALDAMAQAITATVAGSNPLMVCLMNGGVVPFGKLLPRFNFPLQIDYVHATRYREKLYGSDLEWRAGPFVSASNRTVVLIDDILDSGETLAAIEKFYLGQGARRVYKAVLTVKNRLRSLPITADFPGLEVPDRYVFGYGMDYKGYLRNAPGIYALVESLKLNL